MIVSRNNYVILHTNIKNITIKQGDDQMIAADVFEDDKMENWQW